MADRYPLKPIYAGAFLLQIPVLAGVAVLGGPPLIVLAIPVAVLTGLAFAGPIAAFSATQRTVEKFNAVFRFGITPLFLFSGTFFPIQAMPDALQAGLLSRREK